MSLEIYEQYGFKFFLCKADKTPDIKTGHKDAAGKWQPDSWQDPKLHITREQAEDWQKKGRMIGAWLPEDVIVMDLDRHEGKPDGVAQFNKIKEQYNVQAIAFQSDTYCVRTKNGGFHVFFTAEGHTFRQGGKAPGIDLKTHAGYVIAVGSPGYQEISTAEPMALPDTLAAWLESCQSEPEKAQAAPKADDTPVLLPAGQFKRILNKIDVTHFRSNDRWLQFITSCIATAGNAKAVLDALEEWSKGDPEYTGDRSVVKRIESFEQDGGITIGTFIQFLHEEDISSHLIKKVISFDKAQSFLVKAEQAEIELPFQDPDYEELSFTVEAGEFYSYQGNRAAAVLLARALRGKVIFVEGEEKRYFFFDGNRWARLPDRYEIIYTILFRIAKLKHAEKPNNNTEAISQVISALNSKQWKENTASELAVKDGIFREVVKWDSVSIKETVTTKDGVLDFSTRELKTRKGLPEEYRRSHVPYTSREIIDASTPEKYIEFLHDTFPNEDTFWTARYASSTCISGNANRRTFQIWVGDGYNGKSTWIDVIKKTLGEKAKGYGTNILLEQKFQSLGTTPELAEFEGAYVMFGIEVDSGKKFQLSIIKNLTGGDDITVNPKYQHVRDIKATWQLVFACNELPSFNESDEAFIDRLLILPFKRRYYKDAAALEGLQKKGVAEEYIKEAGDKDIIESAIVEERAAIIKLMITDYIDLFKNHRGVIPESAESLQEKMRYREQNDLVGDFVRNACEVNFDNVGYCATFSDLAEAYANYVGLRSVSSAFISKELMKYDARLKKVTVGVERDGGKKTTARALRFIRLADPAAEQLPF